MMIGTNAMHFSSPAREINSHFPYGFNFSHNYSFFRDCT